MDNYLDYNLNRDLGDVPVYTGLSLFNTTTKCITLLLIVQSLLHCNPPNIWIKITEITIQIECLHGTKFLDPGLDIDNYNVLKAGTLKRVCDVIVSMICNHESLP